VGDGAKRTRVVMGDLSKFQVPGCDAKFALGPYVERGGTGKRAGCASGKYETAEISDCRGGALRYDAAKPPPATRV